MEARVALTLRLLGGLTTEEVARAFLVSEPTIAQRVVRAKRTLAEKRVPFEVPHGEARAERLASEPSLKAYHLLPSVRGDLLKKLGRLDEAGAEFGRAASLTRNDRERRLLLDRAAACSGRGT